MNEKIGADNILALCGNPLQPSYTTPKILWYQRNMPEVYAKTTKILQSNSYIAYMLTGQMSQDLSQGAEGLLSRALHAAAHMGIHVKINSHRKTGDCPIN